MRSGDDHCDQELADEVRRRPLRSRAGRRGPATTTAIKSLQMRPGDDRCDQELADEVRRERRKEERGRRRTSASSRASDIRSNNPHLAGGEKHYIYHIVVTTPDLLGGPELPGLEWASRWTYLELRYNVLAGLELIEFQLLQIERFNLQLCSSILVPLCASILGALCID